MVLLCFRLISIVGPRPIFNYLMISYGVVWFSYVFGMYPVDFSRRPFGSLIFIVFHWFSYGFDMFLVDFSRLARSSLIF